MKHTDHVGSLEGLDVDGLASVEGTEINAKRRRTPYLEGGTWLPRLNISASHVWPPLGRTPASTTNNLHDVVIPTANCARFSFHFTRINNLLNIRLEAGVS